MAAHTHQLQKAQCRRAPWRIFPPSTRTTPKARPAARMGQRTEAPRGKRPKADRVFHAAATAREWVGVGFFRRQRREGDAKLHGILLRVVRVGQLHRVGQHVRLRRVVLPQGKCQRGNKKWLQRAHGFLCGCGGTSTTVAQEGYDRPPLPPKTRPTWATARKDRRLRTASAVQSSGEPMSRSQACAKERRQGQRKGKKKTTIQHGQKTGAHTCSIRRG